MKNIFRLGCFDEGVLQNKVAPLREEKRRGTGCSRFDHGHIADKYIRNTPVELVAYNGVMHAKHTIGVVRHDDELSQRTDYLYRVSLKCLVRNENGEVLVVKEAGRDWWDLTGGGMDNGESLKMAIAREMKEEVNLEEDFEYQIIGVDEPGQLRRAPMWQLRLIFSLSPRNNVFSVGAVGDAVVFKDPASFKGSNIPTERRIYEYCGVRQ